MRRFLLLAAALASLGCARKVSPDQCCLQGTGSGSGPCDAAPASGGCVRPTIGATVVSATLWVEDPSAEGGGRALDLTANGTAAAAGGHTYRYSGGDTLSGNGQRCFFGFLEVARDDGSTHVRFDYDGFMSSSPTGDGFVYETEVTRQLSWGADPTPEATWRRYAVSATQVGGNAAFTFSLEGWDPLQGCGRGTDLLGLTFQ